LHHTHTIFKELFRIRVRIFSVLILQEKLDLDQFAEGWSSGVFRVGLCCETLNIFYGSASGSDFSQVMVLVPTFAKLWFRFRLRI
jgi:hypothetical protein